MKGCAGQRTMSSSNSTTHGCFSRSLIAAHSCPSIRMNSGPRFSVVDFAASRLPRANRMKALVGRFGALGSSCRRRL